MKRALIYLHIAVFLAGFTGVLGRWIELNESLLVWYRLLITVVTLALLSLYDRKLLKLSPKNRLPVFATGAVVGLHWLFFYGSIKMANVSVALLTV